MPTGSHKEGGSEGRLSGDLPQVAMAVEVSVAGESCEH